MTTEDLYVKNVYNKIAEEFHIDCVIDHDVAIVKIFMAKLNLKKRLRYWIY